MSDRESFIAKVSHAGLCNLPTYGNTWDLTEAVIRDNIPGDLVECGVFAGAQTAIMARVCDLMDSKKYVHLFDSFQGIPMAGANDGDFTPCIGVPPPGKEGALETTGVSACSVDQVKQNMANWGVASNRLYYYIGWFQTLVPIWAELCNRKISLLRLDGDLYESTKVCLEHLYPLLSPGGYCIIDDYALSGCRKAVDEYLEKMDEVAHMVVVEGGGGPVYWKKV